MAMGPNKNHVPMPKKHQMINLDKVINDKPDLMY